MSMSSVTTTTAMAVAIMTKTANTPPILRFNWELF
jgi:hypothetical protein